MKINRVRVAHRRVLWATSALALLISLADERAFAQTQPSAGAGWQALPPVVVQDNRRQAQRRAQPARTRQPARAATAQRARTAAQPAPAVPAETATSPVQGFVAGRSATGTKTDTPLRETPQSISVIPRDQMTAQGVSTLNDALRYTAGATGELYGVDTRGYGIQLRGFTTFGDVLYKDGLQLKSPYFATYLALDPFGAERLEVLRGPASVLYGQNDPGGIINYVSKRPLDRPQHEIELVGGNFKHIEGRFDSTGPLTADKSLLYRVTGVWRDSGTQVDYVDKDRIFIQPSLTWRPNIDTSVTFIGHYQKDKTNWGLQFLPAAGTIFANPNGQIARSRFTGEPGYDKYDLTTYSAGYLFEHHLNDVWTVRQNARYAHLENQQNGVFGLGFNVVDAANPSNPANFRWLNRYGDFGVAKLDGFTLDNQVEAKFVTGPFAHTLLIGIDGQHNKLSDLGGGTNPLNPIDLFNPVYGEVVTRDYATVYRDTLQTQNQLGVYAHDQIRFGNWALALGGRHDWASTDTDDRLNATTTQQRDTAFTGRAGLVYLFENGLSPYVSYSESFIPSLGTDFSNQPFRPETGRQYEAGVKYAPPGWRAFVTLAAFDLCKQNVLTRDPDHANFKIQSGEVCSRGFEAESVAEPLAGLRLKAAYTYVDVRFTRDSDNEGKTPYGVAQHKVALWGDYTIQSGQLAGVGFGGGVRYLGDSWGDDANSFRVPGATVFDALLSYERNGFRVALNASNVFDKTYVASCSGLDYCYYAEGRKITASARYRW